MNVLLTGGASGLGKAITEKLAACADNTVYFTYFKSAEEAGQLERAYANVKGLHCDFTVAADVERLAETVVQNDIQVLVNNALISFERQYFHKLKTAQFVDGFQRNVLPVIRLTQAAIAHFRKQKYGKIITVLSAALVNKPPVGWSEYTAAKAYLLSLSKSWAAENEGFNITSNCISPAFMETALNSGVDERVVEEMKQKHPLKTLLTTAEAADAVSFFVTASQQVNGQNFIINAGQNVI